MNSTLYWAVSVSAVSEEGAHMTKTLLILPINQNVLLISSICFSMEVLGVPIVVAPLDMSYHMYAQEMTWHLFEPATHKVPSLQPPRSFKCFACFWWVHPMKT